MKTPVRAVFLIPILLGLTPLVGAEPRFPKAKAVNGQIMDALPNQVIVKYQKGRSSQTRTRLMQAYGIRSHRRIETLDLEVLSIPPGETIDSFVQKLNQDPDVEFAEPNGLVKALFTPNDPQFASQYSLNATHLNMPPAWDISRGSSTIIIAVLDTGVLPTVTDLVNQVDLSISARMGIDFNGDSDYTDQYGCSSDDGIGDEQSPGPDPTDNNYSDCGLIPNTNVYHGTRVASVIGAEQNNGTAISGVTQNCRLMIVKVLNNVGQGTFEGVANGVIHAVNNGAKVINLSLGSSFPSSAMASAVNHAIQNNVVVVAAAGNDGTNFINYPAAIASVIAVGATDSNDQHASFSCTGTNIDLVAPGVNILTITSTTVDGYSGTSFSAPLVAGVAGLVRSLNPNLTVSQVALYIDYFSDDLGAAGYDTIYGYGRLNAYRTLAAVNSGSSLPSDAASPGKTYPAPNPFNPTSGQPVEFHWPSSWGDSGLEIKVMTMAGDLVRTLHTSQWDGRNEDGTYVSSGLYFYCLKTSGGHSTGKLTVIK